MRSGPQVARNPGWKNPVTGVYPAPPCVTDPGADAAHRVHTDTSVHSCHRALPGAQANRHADMQGHMPTASRQPPGGTRSLETWDPEWGLQHK